MENKIYKIIPLGIAPKYVTSDISVVVPQWSMHINRITWFLRQYVSATPPEIIENTWIIYDEKDQYVRNLLKIYAEKYGINSATVSHSDWSTYKQLLGFQKVKTRLCVKMHNDIYLRRADWAESLVNRFNELDELQLIGSYNNTSEIDKPRLARFLNAYPFFGSLYNKLFFSKTDEVGCPYIGAYFMAMQTYALQAIYAQVIEFEQGKMDKEDCIFTILTSLLRIKITNWENIDEFAQLMTFRRNDFENDMSLPDKPHIINDSNRNAYPEAQWRIVVN